ncbi:Domain of uncharacterised function (DUF2825) [Salmonella enterica]|nr:Domain of uncharacterised function (DUF2825) [Salmonella enterica]
MLEQKKQDIPVYPRWRGEHSLEELAPAPDGGLSPLARGTLAYAAGVTETYRFIPAGAGNTITDEEYNALYSGLSPLARGTLKNLRTIPEVAQVYPRWRGEHLHRAPRLRLPAGLSPLARGTLFDSLDNALRVRFIPAGAGNTPVSRRGVIENPVYPRWRGEHAILRARLTVISGLSPLARGTHNSRLMVSDILRFIPAGAGNTPVNSRCSAISAVYPRWRGEHPSK